jgi:hypothetical protein
MRRLPILTLSFFFAAAANTYAQGLPKHSVELAPQIYQHAYKEPGVMRNNGMMSGLTGAYAYHNRAMLKTQGLLAFGAVDYKNSGTMDNVFDSCVEVRGMGGYDFNLSEGVYLTPYFGIGYRYLNDDSSGKSTSTGAAGYERESNYVYSPLGVECAFQMENNWSIGLATEYDIFWRGKQISHLEDANFSYSRVSNTQKKGYGLRGSLSLKKKAKKIDFVIEPFIRYWNIKKSNNSDVTYAGVIIGYGYEPKNNTTEYGVKLGLNF